MKAKPKGAKGGNEYKLDDDLVVIVYSETFNPTPFAVEFKDAEHMAFVMALRPANFWFKTHDEAEAAREEYLELLREYGVA